MNLKDLKLVEKLLMIFGCLSMIFFVAGYFLGNIFFICFLICMLVLFILWCGAWKCPHCGKRLWYNFEGKCRKCNKSVYEKQEPELKNTKEQTGFFHW